jgi:Tol biopolymer transport system component
MNANGEARVRLCEGINARWSPDASRILHRGSYRERVGIFMYDAIEAVRSQIHGENGPQALAWAPDGKRICYTANQPGGADLVIQSLDETGNAKVRSVRTTGKIGGNLSWSPDGKKILFWKAVDGGQRLHVINPDGDEVPVQLKYPQVGPSDDDPAWSHDGKWIAFCSGEN